MNVPSIILPPQTAHGDPLVVANAAAWAMTGVAAVVLGLRLACRLALARTWWDDWLLLVGLLATVAASGVFSELLRLGFARTALRGPVISLLTIVLDTLQKFALACTKASFSLTLLRVFTPGSWPRWLVFALLLVLNSYLAVNMTFSWVDICEGNSPNRIKTTCITAKNQARLNTVSAFLSAACDFVLAFLPWHVIRKLQMRPMERLGAAIAMSLGALAGVAGVMKGVQTFRIMDPMRPDFFYQVWVFQVWGIAEPCVTVVAASIPVLRGFVRGTRNSRTRSPAATLPAAAGPYSMSNGAGKFASHAGASAATPVSSAADDDDRNGGSEPSGWGARRGSSPSGITRTRRFTVEFDFHEGGGRDEDTYELHPAHRAPAY